MTLTKIASTGVEDSLRWVLGANGTSDYTFTGPGLTGTVNDPTIYLTRGHTYIFQNNSGGHPFYIKTSIANGGTNDAYNTGVTNNGGGNGTEIVFTVPHDSPDILYYQCSSHSSMAGQFNIAGSVADGSISTAKIADDAVTDAKLANSINAAIAANTAKTSNATHTGDVTGSTSLTIADDAVTAAKIADGEVGTAALASNAVTNAKLADDAVTHGKLATGSVGSDALASDAVTAAKIADDAVNGSHLADAAINNTAIIADNVVSTNKLTVGTSSNDGKFLRANNGSAPTFESLPASGVTVGNAADERIVTSDGTNLDAESNFVYRASNNTVGIGTSSPEPTASYYQGACLHIHQAASGGSVGSQVHLTNDYGGSAASDGSQVSHYNHSLYINNQESGDTYFYNNGSSTATIKGSSGKVGIGTQAPDEKLHVNGNIKATSIYLGGSSDALDDYEEGTWTPILADAYTGGNTKTSGGNWTSWAHYTKIGDTVRVYMNAYGMNNTGMDNNQIFVRGLPFTAHGTQTGPLTSAYFDSVDSTQFGLHVQINNTQSVGRLHKLDDNANGSPTFNWNHIKTQNYFNFQFTIVYKTNQ